MLKYRVCEVFLPRNLLARSMVGLWKGKLTNRVEGFEGSGDGSTELHDGIRDSRANLCDVCLQSHDGLLRRCNLRSVEERDKVKSERSEQPKVCGGERQGEE